MFGQQDNAAPGMGMPGSDMNGTMPAPNPAMMNDMGVGGSASASPDLSMPSLPEPAADPMTPAAPTPDASSDPMPTAGGMTPDVTMPEPASSPSDMMMPDNPAPTNDGDSPADDHHADDESTPATPAAAPADMDNLTSLKQQALQQLSPLVGHLDQTPEEKFRTTMMMIQASDDSSLIPQAYEAAGQITDEKVKAQALLDVVNEINYFTQHHENKS